MMLSGCEENLSAVHPAGPAAQEIARLWWVMLAGSAAIFVFVMALLAVALLRPRREAGSKGSARIWIFGLGLGFPFAVLGALLAYGLVIGERLMPRGVPDLVTVQAEARQWEWRFGYDDRPGHVTNGMLFIPAGRPVDVEISTVDVIHGFWVPRLAGKLDAVPGHVNVLRIEAWHPGDYAGVSAEFSGTGYREHGFTVRALDPESWAAFLRETP